MNPYQPPPPVSIDERVPASKIAGAPRRFRWRTIPAALSWGFGGVSLIVIPFGVYHTLKMLALPTGAEWAARMMVYASLTMVPCLLLSGCLNCVAGMRWLRGRWLQALLLNAGAYGVMAVPELMHNAAINAMRNM